MTGRKGLKPLKTGEAVSLYAAALITAGASIGMLFVCWPVAIPYFLGTVFLALWAWFRSPTLIVTAESITISQPRRGINAVYPWSRYHCLYRLDGIHCSLLVLSPEKVSKLELRALVKARKTQRSISGEINGCLVLADGRNPVRVLANIPESVQRMPYSDCISL